MNRKFHAMSKLTDTTPPIRRFPEAKRRPTLTARPRPVRRCIIATLDRIDYQMMRLIGEAVR
jgi:hypothetical protein